MPTDEHEHFMRRCVALGRIALQRNNPPVGSLLVSGGRILAEASEEASSSKDVTDHAELILLKRAWPTLNAEQKRSAILYSTHEPCVMCSYAIRHYGVPTIVYGCRTPFAGGYSSKYSILRETEHASWTTVPRVIEGILETECPGAVCGIRNAEVNISEALNPSGMRVGTRITTRQPGQWLKDLTGAACFDKV